MLGRISCCQRGAYLFLSSRSSVRQVSDPQSVAVSVSRRPLLIAFLFSGKHRKKKKNLNGRRKFKLVKSLCHQAMSALQLVYMLIALHDAHLLLFFSFAFSGNIPTAEMNQTAQTCQEGLLFLHF